MESFLISDVTLASGNLKCAFVNIVLHITKLDNEIQIAINRIIDYENNPYVQRALQTVLQCSGPSSTCVDVLSLAHNLVEIMCVTLNRVVCVWPLVLLNLLLEHSLSSDPDFSNGVKTCSTDGKNKENQTRIICMKKMDFSWKWNLFEDKPVFFYWHKRYLFI